MKYRRTVKGCTTTDQLRNDDIQKQLDTFPLFEKITEYRDKRKIHLQKTKQTLFHYKPEPTVHLADKET